MSLQIQLAYAELDKVKELFTEYQVTMRFALRFRNFEEELALLPGKYALPYGRLYIAMFNGNLVGCIALRAIDKERCEMKRFYVRSQFRKLGIGRALAEKIIEDAKNIGYLCMLLDTSASLRDSISLYRTLGFIDVDPYYNNPNDNVVYLGLDLSNNLVSRKV
jgi:ribosomal protein S18 acetylase RimI-like enzyme